MTVATDAPIKVLVADDDASIRNVLSMLLSKAGYEPLIAESGTQAISLVGEEIPDLIILDVKMPDLDGYETCRQLKADTRFADIPIIFLSGKADPDDRVTGLDVGAVDYVIKPFNAHELMARVRASLRTSRHSKLRKLNQLEEELDLAARIQQSLLPREMPEVEGLEIHGDMIPMRKVGGDYYDFVDGVDTLIACIGDVAGKGIPAALVMVMARTFLNHWDVNLSDTRMSLLALNRLLYDNTDAGIFMSMVLFKWQSDVKKMSYTGAGHEHLLIYRGATDKIERLKTGGQVMGLRANIIKSLEEKEMPFSIGDSILIYTDGVTEAMSPKGEEYTLDQLERDFTELRNESPKVIVETVFERLAAFTDGHKQTDDITLVVIRRTD